MKRPLTWYERFRPLRGRIRGKLPLPTLLPLFVILGMIQASPSIAVGQAKSFYGRFNRLAEYPTTMRMHQGRVLYSIRDMRSKEIFGACSCLQCCMEQATSVELLNGAYELVFQEGNQESMHAVASHLENHRLLGGIGAVRVLANDRDSMIGGRVAYDADLCLAGAIVKNLTTGAQTCPESTGRFALPTSDGKNAIQLYIDNLPHGKTIWLSGGDFICIKIENRVLMVNGKSSPSYEDR